ncbi:MAG: phospholipid carrier-dependent glycosyltransferase [Chloracidobacterium sp.]|nr:phospholipid carrier-dependent glycosyltransferase [Chloracidobacterium sp.]
MIAMVAADPQEGPVAIATIFVMSAVFIYLFRRFTDEKEFVTYIYLAALAARMVFGIIIHTYELRDFVGPDSMAYGIIGSKIVDFWLGLGDPTDPEVTRALSLRGPGWGMNYFVGFIYLVAGKSIFAAQSLCATIGAATVPMVYYCSNEIFHNRRSAKFAAFGVAFFPAFIIWSSQLLKDGLIVFLLVLAMTIVLQIQKQFSITGVILLILSLSGIMSLRFYIFYMVATAVIGSFIVGLKTSTKAIIQRTLILLVIGLAMTYLGVIRIASIDFETYGSLERIQVSRADMATSGESGYGANENVSTVGGALAALPTGFSIIMFAPFPWELKNFRQSLTLPEIILWWSMIPLLIYGLWFAIRQRLRASFPVLIFTLMLTISYSIFQGNLGAAYRQRTQIQVFLFIFIAVAIGLILEKIEDKRTLEIDRQKTIARKLRARFHEQQKAI